MQDCPFFFPNLTKKPLSLCGWFIQVYLNSTHHVHWIRMLSAAVRGNGKDATPVLHPTVPPTCALVPQPRSNLQALREELNSLAAPSLSFGFLPSEDKGLVVCLGSNFPPNSPIQQTSLLAPLSHYLFHWGVLIAQRVTPAPYVGRKELSFSQNIYGASFQAWFHAFIICLLGINTQGLI